MANSDDFDDLDIDHVDHIEDNDIYRDMIQTAIEESLRLNINNINQNMYEHDDDEQFNLAIQESLKMQKCENVTHYKIDEKNTNDFIDSMMDKINYYKNINFEKKSTEVKEEKIEEKEEEKKIHQPTLEELRALRLKKFY